MYSVFISHNSRDKGAVREIATYLERTASLNCFLDAWDLKAGQSYSSEIETAMRASNSAAFFYGEHGASTWVNEEFELAHLRAMYTNNAFSLIAVLLPGGTDTEIPDRLRVRSRVDFRAAGIADENELLRLVAGIKGESLRSTGAIVHVNGEFTFTSKSPKKPSPRLLAGLCNRRHQSDQLIDVVTQKQNHVNHTKPMCFIVAGDEDQGHEFFVSRLIHYTLPNSIGISPFTEFVGQGYIEAPEQLTSAEAYQQRLHQRVCEALNLARTTSKLAVAQKIASHQGPYLISTDFFADQWHDQGQQRLQLFTDYWLDWPLESLNQAIVVCVCLRYGGRSNSLGEKVGNWFRGTAKVRQSIQQVVAAAAQAQQLVPLDELTNVMPIDINHWSKLAVVDSAYPGLQLDAQLGELIKDRSGIPMKPAVERIEQFLNAMTKVQ